MMPMALGCAQLSRSAIDRKTTRGEECVDDEAAGLRGILYDMFSAHRSPRRVLALFTAPHSMPRRARVPSDPPNMPREQHQFPPHTCCLMVMTNEERHASRAEVLEFPRTKPGAAAARLVRDNG